MNDKFPLIVNESCDTLVLIHTNDKRLAKQLADYHLALAQAYRQIAGMEPLPTGSHLRKVIRDSNR